MNPSNLINKSYTQAKERYAQLGVDTEEVLERLNQISFLKALLEPNTLLKEYENSGKGYEKLAMMEEMKLMPFGDVWNYFCLQNNVPIGVDVLKEVGEYEKTVLSGR